MSPHLSHRDIESILRIDAEPAQKEDAALRAAMTPLSTEAERNLLDALTAPGNGWMSSWQATFDIIRAHYACSAESADRIFDDLLVKRKLIVFVTQFDSPFFSYKWKRHE